MKSKSVKNSLTLMCLMIVLVSVIVIGGISISNISTMTSTANKNYENARLDGYNTEIKSQVQSVIAILQAEYDKSQNGDLTEDEAKKEAAEIVRNMLEKIKPHFHLVETARKATRMAGLEPEEIPVRGGTDGAMLSWKGLPCPNLGTGGFNFHGVCECITAERMDRCTEILLNIIKLYAE